MAKKKYYNEKKRVTNEKYDTKTYKRFSLKLRIVDDAEIIEDMEKARESGLSYRQWLNNLWNQTK